MFVYGTLRRCSDHPMAALLRACAEFVGVGLMSGRLYDQGAYPAAVYDEGTPARVVGDVFRLLDATVVAELDAYEGVGAHGEYERRQVPVEVDGQVRLCWVYLLRKEHMGQQKISPSESGIAEWYGICQNRAKPL